MQGGRGGDLEVLQRAGRQLDMAERDPRAAQGSARGGRQGCPGQVDIAADTGGRPGFDHRLLDSLQRAGLLAQGVDPGVEAAKAGDRRAGDAPGVFRKGQIGRHRVGPAAVGVDALRRLAYGGLVRADQQHRGACVGRMVGHRQSEAGPGAGHHDHLLGERLEFGAHDVPPNLVTDIPG